MGVNIIGIRPALLDRRSWPGKPIGENDCLQGHNVRPACFLLDQGAVEDKPAIIIQGGDLSATGR